MGISQNKWHKRLKTGGKRKQSRKKRKHQLGRPAANTRIGAERIHPVRVRGGNKKYRALRLDHGTFAWASERIARKTRIIDTVYNAAGNELVRTKTLVKNAIVIVDAAPFRQWYENHYAIPLGRKKGTKITDIEGVNVSEKALASAALAERQKLAPVDHLLEEQFQSGRLKACISSRPGQTGRADGYILEGKELEFYIRKIKARKAK